MSAGLSDIVGEAVLYAVKASGAGLKVIQEVMIALLGIESGLGGNGQDAYWLQLQATKTDGTVLTATVLVDDPRLTPAHTAKTRVLRYIYQEGDHRPLEYVNAIRGGAVTTPFGLLERFFPVFADGGRDHPLFADTGTYLGLEIHKVGTRHVATGPPADGLRLELNPDLLVGTGRNTRDVEGKRIWTGEDYTYRAFAPDEYDEMIDAGINYFWVNEGQEAAVWRKPVFYLKWAGRNLVFPEMFYRANCRGTTMFMDEPAIHLGWFFERHPAVALALSGPAGAARLLEARIREDYEKGHYCRHRLHQLLRSTYDLGRLVIEENHYPVWETQEWSAWYQLRAGLPGIVHEGRYTNQANVTVLNAEYDVRIPDTPANNLAIRYAWFRGAARAFDGDWGTAIYGQCEQSIAPLAMTRAYDMGARYVWFWTSDRLHHVPYPEQLALARHLTEHARRHPRPPLDVLRRAAHTAIVVPDGYPLSEYMMWGSPVFHLDRVNADGSRYRDVLHEAALQIERCLKESVAFDLLYDDGHESWKTYNEAVVVDTTGAAGRYREGQFVGRPPLPARTEAERQSRPPAIRIRSEAAGPDPPLTVRLIADIDSAGQPVGLRCRDWGTPDWTRLEAFWFVFDDPACPRFAVGRQIEHTFTAPGTYRVTAWTCNTDGVPARAETHVIVPER